LRLEVSKNFSAVASSDAGELVTSITTSPPARAASPARVVTSTPVRRDAATIVW
jgi:hypothetical protein